MAERHPCEYFGVTCNMEDKVVNITLVNIGLSGKIPPGIGFLRHLQILNLAENELTGNLPSDLRFAPLEELNVSGNQLTGQIPPMLCLTGDINGNGEHGVFQCDVIACPEGSYSFSGIAELQPGINSFRSCRPCPSNIYLANTKCSEISGFTSSMIELMDTSE